MFSNLLFLIFVLLLVTLTPDSTQTIWQYTPQEALSIGLAIYLITLGLIAFQNFLFKHYFRRYSGNLLFLANVELLIFLSYFFYVLGAQRIVEPYSLQFFNVIFALVFYFGGLFVFHLTSYSRKKHFHLSNRWQYAKRELLLLLPFAVPFLILSILSDVIVYFFYPASPDNNLWALFALLGVIISFIIIMMIFLPFWIQKMWQCKPLPHSDLRTRLQQLCKVAHFKHAGLKTWSVLDHALTAAIIGIFPRYRYVMFSKRLLKELPETSVEAVLAHEIGHNYHRHLWIYPFIFFGMSVVLTMASLFIPETKNPYSPFIVFVVYGIIMALYFRIVFGFFSRLFERQADLHIFMLNIPPQYLIEALDHIGTATGNSHKHPNWHHHSIQERIDFIEQAADNPKLISEHHKYVKTCVWIYFFVLALGFGLLVFF